MTLVDLFVYIAIIISSAIWILVFKNKFDSTWWIAIPLGMFAGTGTIFGLLFLIFQVAQATSKKD